MRIKTINAIVSDIKMVDGGSAVNQGMIRTLIETKELDFFHRGNRLVSNADKFAEDMNRIFGIDEKNSMPRVRSIHNAFLELREINPELGLSEERIRALVGMDVIPHIRVGNRAYVALECFEEPYNEHFLYDDYRDSEEAMLERIAKEQLEKNLERRSRRKQKNIA